MSLSKRATGFSTFVYKARRPFDRVVSLHLMDNGKSMQGVELASEA